MIVILALVLQHPEERSDGHPPPRVGARGVARTPQLRAPMRSAGVRSRRKCSAQRRGATSPKHYTRFPHLCHQEHRQALIGSTSPRRAADSRVELGREGERHSWVKLSRRARELSPALWCAGRFELDHGELHKKAETGFSPGRPALARGGDQAGLVRWKPGAPALQLL